MRADWQEEQDRLAEIEKFNVDHAEALEMNAAFDKALADRIDSDHEIALLMNEKVDLARRMQGRNNHQCLPRGKERRSHRMEKQTRAIA